MRRAEQKLVEAGYKFRSFEYDYDAQKRAARYESDGLAVELLRERTDCPGLKMFSIWTKEA